MTPAEIITAANTRYNSVGDAFFPDSEGYLLIWQAQMQLALAGNLIEKPFTTLTVASTQSYDYPTNAYAISRVTYAGAKVSVISFRQDDILSLYNQQTTSTGTPRYAVDFGNALYLRPIPDAVATLKVWAYCRPQAVTSTTAALEIGDEWAMEIPYLMLAEKSAKNKNYVGASMYMGLWKEALSKAAAHKRKIKRAGGFATVVDVDAVPESFLGTV